MLNINITLKLLHTKIAEYYRNLLNEEIKEKKIIDLVKPSLKEGIELMNKEEYDKLNQYAPSQDKILDNNNKINNENNNNNNNFSNILNVPKKQNIYVNPFGPEYSNSNPNNNTNSNPYSNNNNNNNNKEEDFNFEQHLNNFADSMSNVFSNISQKAQSIDYNEKLRNAGEYIKEQKEKIENSETFKGFMGAISKGFDNFINAADNYLNNTFDDSNQQRRNNNNYDNRNQNQVQFQGQRINNINSDVISSNMNYSGINNNDNDKKDNNEYFNFKNSTPFGNNMNNFGNINYVGESDKNDNVENLDDNEENNNK